MPALTFKIASEPWEFEQVHRLVYQGFVEEIPYLPPNAEQRLVDRFHDENVYAIAIDTAIDRGRVVGMCAIRDRRPFSVEQKLSDFERHLPAHAKAAEFRLLYIEPAYRNAVTFRELLETLTSHCIAQGVDLAVIAGTTRQLRLYRHIGFVPFGPLVGAPDAQFQPMYWTLDAVARHVRWLRVVREQELQPVAG